MMWIFARRTGDPWWRERAEHYSRLIEERKHDRNVHDLGFLFWSTYKRWFDWEGDPAVEEVVITAGQTMGLRFNEKGKYLRSFVAPESTFIDIMMNVGIIFYAASRTGDEDLMRRVSDHCLTTRRYLVRGDGSSAHEGVFDLETGEFLRESTHQGWRERLIVGKRAIVGALWIRHRVPAQRRPSLSRDRTDMRRLLHRA